MAFNVGDTIGDYEVIGILGAGGMGKVYKVRSVISDRIEALKILLPDLENSSELADRFLREIKVQASLNHPNIAGLHAAMHYENQLLMFLEYVEGQTLGQRLRQGAIELWEGVDYMTQVLGALSYAHDRGVIHRDIKPANIMLTRDRVAKLMDFGIAKVASERNLTKSGLALGSLYYMAPEQVRSLPPDARSDIYSVGATLYEVVTGQRPIQGDSEYAVMTAHLQRTPAPPAQLNPAVPAELSSVILRALAKEPQDRFQTADEFRSALASLRGGSREASQAWQAFLDQIEHGAPPPPPAPALDPVVVGKIESELTSVLGPIARVLVKKASAEAADLNQLCQALAQQIPAGGERDTFIRRCRRELGLDAAPGVKTPPTPPLGVRSGGVDAAVTQKAIRALAVYIGPIAKPLAERAAKTCATPEQLYEMLAEEIPSEKDRRAFLASVNR